MTKFCHRPSVADRHMNRFYHHHIYLCIHKRRLPRLPQIVFIPQNYTQKTRGQDVERRTQNELSSLPVTWRRCPWDHFIGHTTPTETVIQRGMKNIGSEGVDTLWWNTDAFTVVGTKSRVSPTSKLTGSRRKVNAYSMRTEDITDMGTEPARCEVMPLG